MMNVEELPKYGMDHCWRAMREGKLVECKVSKCCYDSSCHSVFEYWSYATSDEWKSRFDNPLIDFDDLEEEAELVYLSKEIDTGEFLQETIKREYERKEGGLKDLLDMIMKYLFTPFEFGLNKETLTFLLCISLGFLLVGIIILWWF